MDVVIFGGGAAGLWLLDELTRRGRRAVLLEAYALGTGQTIAAHGIIHGGWKFPLPSFLTKGANNLGDTPAIWRKCLDGQREPDLRTVRRRADECFLWRTDSVASRLGMWGAQLGLRAAPQPVPDDERPELLRDCPGTVARLPEPVLSPVSLIEVLAARHRERLLKVDSSRITFECGGPGEVRSIHLGQANGDNLQLHPRIVVFTAGVGNSALRRRVALTTEVMQRRPLQIVLLRGKRLPHFHGHCIDGTRTRVTITSDADSRGRIVWQIGGQIAEDGVAWDAQTLVTKARDELLTVLPNLDLSAARWSTHRVDRADGIVAGGKQPRSVQIRGDGNCLTAWPTKLTLVPQLVAEIVKEISKLERTAEDRLFANRGLGRSPTTWSSRNWERLPSNWPRPEVALPPWETATQWITNEDLAAPVQLPSLRKAA